MMAKESAGSARGSESPNGTGSQDHTTSLDALSAAARAVSEAAAEGRLPPVDAWNPPFCGDIDIRIARDGTWFHDGTPIGRPALVRLFSSILRQDPDGTMLVTPVEKLRIRVDDAPFVAVEMQVHAGEIALRTNVDQWVRADAEHPLSFRPGPSGGLKPYLLVRAGLEALVSRAVFMEMVERGEVRDGAAGPEFGIASAGVFFPMAPFGDIEGLM